MSLYQKINFEKVSKSLDKNSKQKINDALLSLEVTPL